MTKFTNIFLKANTKFFFHSYTIHTIYNITIAKCKVILLRFTRVNTEYMSITINIPKEKIIFSYFICIVRYNTLLIIHACFYPFFNINK